MVPTGHKQVETMTSLREQRGRCLRELPPQLLQIIIMEKIFGSLDREPDDDVPLYSDGRKGINM